MGIISGENPRFKASASGHEAMGEAIKQMGLKAEPREGKYGLPEKSWLIHGPSREQMYQLGHSFGQESVVFSHGGKHELIHTNGPNAGRFHPAAGHEFFAQEPEDYYTHMPEMGGYLRLNFDWDKLHPTNLSPEGAVQALQHRAEHSVTKSEIKSALVQTLKKALLTVQPAASAHPHSYPWHNEHTDHHLHVQAPGVVMRSNPSLSKADVPEGTEHLKPPVNEQAAPVGTSTYAKHALPYGSVDKTNPQDLYHYPYEGRNQDIDKLVKDHGYSTYYAGGKHGRPDLASRNYNTKHLMIYDPSPHRGGDFGTEAKTDAWRKIHELAHALTLPDVNKLYGEGRRIGKLGTHRTMREGLRSVHWEHLAVLKQRELSKQIGIHIPDHVFNKEYNTVLHDAVHRAITGKFTEPGDEGFKPHEHQIPLETSLGMVREAGHGMGITGMHDLLRKYEREYALDEVRRIVLEYTRGLLKKHGY